MSRTKDGNTMGANNNVIVKERNGIVLSVKKCHQ